MAFSLSPSPVQRWLIPAVVGDPTKGLVPAAGYFFKYFEAGLGTGFPKTVYQDASGTPFPTPSNWVQLNSEGYAVIYFGPGSHALQVTDPLGAQIAYIDPLDGVGVSGGVGGAFLEHVIADDDPMSNGLAQLDTNANLIAYCAGYYAAGDGGSGNFYNKTASDADDTGYIIASTFDSSKKWFRIPDTDEKVRAAYFGVTIGIVGNITEKLIAADAYAVIVGATLLIPQAQAGDVSSITFSAPVVEFETGAYLRGIIDGGSGLPTSAFAFHGIVKADLNRDNSSVAPIMTVPLSVAFNSKQTVMPEWLEGTSDNNSPTARDKNKKAFDFAAASGAGVVVVSPGIWYFNTADSYTLPSTSQLWLVQGTLKDQASTLLYSPGIYCNGFRISGPLSITNDLHVGGSASVAGAQTIGANLTVGGTAEATSIISDSIIVANNEISSKRGSITAGTDLAAVVSLMISQAGRTTKQFAAMGRIFKNISQSGPTANTGSYTDLMNYSYTGDTLTLNNDALIMECGGAVDQTTGAFSVALYCGVDLIAEFNFLAPTTATSGTAQGWHIRMTINQNGGVSTIDVSGDGTAWNRLPVDIWPTDIALSIPLTTSQNMQLKGKVAAGGYIVQKYLYVDYVPAPI